MNISGFEHVLHITIMFHDVLEVSSTSRHKLQLDNLPYFICSKAIIDYNCTMMTILLHHHYLSGNLNSDCE
jgi:hypothetical protein